MAVRRHQVGDLPSRKKHLSPWAFHIARMRPTQGLLEPFKGLNPGQEWAEQDFEVTETGLLQGEAGPVMLRGPVSRLLPGGEIQHQPSTPAHIPYHSLEYLLSIRLQVPSWAGGACGVLPLRRASWHMPVIGPHRVMDFPPAWGKVRVCPQALVTPEVVCAEGECEVRWGTRSPCCRAP